MKNIKYFIGPMSKNVVDAIKDFSVTNNKNIGLIPSRRQVEFDGGYVNNWTTKEFSKYANDLFLVRDHGGPLQGNKEDSGYQSLLVDCDYFDMIHVDPWKKTQDLEDGIKLTIDIINYCYRLNKKILFEVGTEESIRKFSVKEVEILLNKLKEQLPKEQYNNILYCVIQSGTSLQETKNTGDYDSSRLESMLQVVKSKGLLAKEHNGDFLEQSLINEKFSLGLDSINIAPEFGQIETNVYLDKIKSEKPSLFKTYWQICYNSGRWKKWVSKDFDPNVNKEKLIRICGHYILSNRFFIQNIKDEFPTIDRTIRQRINQKLESLF